MFKALLATSLLATASANEQDALKAGASITQHAKNNLHNIQTVQSSKALNIVNEFKLANKGVTLQAQGVTKRVTKASTKTTSVRSLRGKGGKGKGKGKDDDDEEEVSGDLFLQMSSGMCAGADIGFGAIAEDTYLYHVQMKSGACTNVVGNDGTYHSYAVHLVADTFAISEKVYSMDNCQEVNLIDTVDITEHFTFGGAVTPNNMCTSVDGYGVRLTVSDKAVTMPAGFIAHGQNAKANTCVGGDLSSHDYVELQAAGLMTPGGYGRMCSSNDDSDDDISAPVSGSYEYDLSSCGAGSLVVNHFSDDNCEVLVESSTHMAQYCYFDVPSFAAEMLADTNADFYISTQYCTSA